MPVSMWFLIYLEVCLLPEDYKDYLVGSWLVMLLESLSNTRLERFARCEWAVAGFNELFDIFR